MWHNISSFKARSDLFHFHWFFHHSILWNCVYLLDHILNQFSKDLIVITCHEKIIHLCVHNDTFIYPCSPVNSWLGSFFLYTIQASSPMISWPHSDLAWGCPWKYQLSEVFDTYLCPFISPLQKVQWWATMLVSPADIDTV